MTLECLSHYPTRPTGKTPLVFVHGAWHGAWCWEENFLPYFAAHGYEAHAPSLRAHGGNDRSRIRWMRIDDYIDDLAVAVAQIERPPVLIGHSMGGLIVQRYVERTAPAAVVLLASVPPGGILGVMLRMAGRHPLLFLASNAQWSLYPIIHTPKLAREAFFALDMPIEDAHRLWKQLQNESYLAFLDMLLFRHPRPHLAFRANTPTLVLGAADDRIITNDEVRRTAAAYNTEAEIFANLPHDMMLDRLWRTVADRILTWLGQHGL